jgi:hypothetical protein
MPPYIIDSMWPFRCHDRSVQNALNLINCHDRLDFNADRHDHIVTGTVITQSRPIVAILAKLLFGVSGTDVIDFDPKVPAMIFINLQLILTGTQQLFRYTLYEV